VHDAVAGALMVMLRFIAEKGGMYKRHNDSMYFKMVDLAYSSNDGSAQT
jgi:hypothetical protein